MWRLCVMDVSTDPSPPLPSLPLLRPPLLLPLSPLPLRLPQHWSLQINLHRLCELTDLPSTHGLLGSAASYNRPAAHPPHHDVRRAPRSKNPNPQIFSARGRSSGFRTQEEVMSRHPSTKWAQRSDKVFLTIELPDARDVKLNLKPEGQFTFTANGPADDTPYELDLELFDAVNVEESKAAVAPRTICYLIKKAEKKWWSRLLKKEGKSPVFLKVDWDKWQDEDDEDIGSGDFGDMDFSV
ncbi:hypothetical protein GUJ93_ZPchr0013g37834 [Zizania palustris]|uniref:Co-chaperone protein p23 n=1 Tax=Zizania palustris TaxID=103762 RepID=A0A8J5WX82_ZIZPA|nr:hypothetical protein GUJ93_ZPchr0013g37834 [Zizania palustris]